MGSFGQHDPACPQGGVQFEGGVANVRLEQIGVTPECLADRCWVQAGGGEHFKRLVGLGHILGHPL